MKLRFIALALLVTFLLSGCAGLQKKNNNQSSAPSEVISEVKDAADTQYISERSGVSVACSATDSFCPYTAETSLNRELGTLLYDSLIILDNSFSPQKSLANEIEINKKTVTVTIKPTTFWDGSSLTSDDVVYCAQKAMKSKTRYGYALEDVETVSVSGSQKIIFNLSKEDPYFINCLTFPIYKKGTDKKQSSDNIEIPPMGSGRYIINDEKTELKANANFHAGKPKLAKINLINTPDEDALHHNLEVGNISYYYSDLSDCSLPGIRGKYQSINLNNLVFLGVNMESGVMSNTAMRQAVSAAIDRGTVAEKAYYGNAVPATGVFNPEWCEKDSIMQTTETTVNENVYLAHLEKIGYNVKDNSGYYVNSKGERLTLKLVCYKGNEWRTAAAKIIKSDLKSAGILVKIENLSWDEYNNALKNRYFDLYIAEVAVGNNMDISELVTKKGSAAYGVYYEQNKDSKKDKDSKDESKESSSSLPLAESTTSSTASKIEESEEIKEDYAGETAETVKEFYKGNATLQQVVTAFANELPLIPVCYRTGVVSYAAEINNITPSYGDVFGGIENTSIGKK